MKRFLKNKYTFSFFISAWLMISIQCDTQPNYTVDVSGELMQWHKVVLTFTGPETSEMSEVNAFSDYRLDVTFDGPSGQVYKIRGFYAADGNAAESSAENGDKWKAFLIISH